jgi:hypothetical protein
MIGKSISGNTMAGTSTQATMVKVRNAFGSRSDA